MRRVPAGGKRVAELQLARHKSEAYIEGFELYLADGATGVHGLPESCYDV